MKNVMQNRSGIYYILPILLLMYLLMIERKSPGLSAFWSKIGMLLILLTQNPLKGSWNLSDICALLL